MHDEITAPRIREIIVSGLNRAIEPLPGQLADGRKVVRVESSQFQEEDGKAAYGYFIINPDSFVFQLNTQTVLPVVNELLSRWNLPQVAHVPEFVVLNSNDVGKDFQLQFVDIESAMKKNKLEQTKEAPIGLQRDHAIRLEDDLLLVNDANNRVVIIDEKTDKTYNGRYRKAATQIPVDMLRGLTNSPTPFPKEWQSMYAREMARTILVHGLPEYASRASSLAEVSSWETMQAQAHSLDELVEQVVSNKPTNYWRSELETRVEETIKKKRVSKTTGEQFDFDASTPPHLGISDIRGKARFAITAELLKEQQQLYQAVAKFRKGDLTGTAEVSQQEVMAVEQTITDEELGQYLAAKEDRPRQAEREYTAALKLTLAQFGVTPDMLSGLDLHSSKTGVSDLDIQSRERSHVSSRSSMFDAAVGKEISDRPQWGAEIHSPLPQVELARGMAHLASKPLFEIKPPADRSPESLAETVFSIITSQAVEAKNSNSRSTQAETTIKRKIEDSIRAGKPIDFLIFGPWGTAPSILRSGGRQTPHLGHLDFLAHMLRVNATIEQVYKPEDMPAMRINWINESSSFAGILFDSTREEIERFQEQMLGLLNILHPVQRPEQQIFQVQAMRDIALGTQEDDPRVAIFNEFRGNYARHTREQFDLYDAERGLSDKTQTPEQRAWVEERRQLCYPLSTITNPYDVLPLGTSLSKIALAYEMIRADVFGNQTQFNEKFGAKVDDETRSIARALYNKARELVIEQYVPIMDSRYHTAEYVSPESAEVYRRHNPWNALYEGKIHGRITDGGKDRLWFTLNTGNPIIHPTHGLPVIQPGLRPSDPHHFTIRTYAEIAAEPERYAAVYLEGDEKGIPHHFIQLK